MDGNCTGGEALAHNWRRIGSVHPGMARKRPNNVSLYVGLSTRRLGAAGLAGGGAGGGKVGTERSRNWYWCWRKSRRGRRRCRGGEVVRREIWYPVKAIFNVVEQLVKIWSGHWSRRYGLSCEPPRESDLMPPGIIAGQQISWDLGGCRGCQGFQMNFARHHGVKM